MKRVSAPEAKKLQDEGWTYVDVRSEPEFDGGHPPGAVNVSMHSPDFFEAMASRFKKDQQLIIGCLMGPRSARAAAALEAQGYTQLVDAAEGFSGWVQAKLPVAKGKS